MTDDDIALLRRLQDLPEGAPQLFQLQETVDQMEGKKISIRGDEMRMQLGDRTETVRFSVVEQSGDVLKLRFEDDSGEASIGQIRLGPEGSLIFIDSRGEQLVFERAKRP